MKYIKGECGYHSKEFGLYSVADRKPLKCIYLASSYLLSATLVSALKIAQQPHCGVLGTGSMIMST